MGGGRPVRKAGEYRGLPERLDRGYGGALVDAGLKRELEQKVRAGERLTPEFYQPQAAAEQAKQHG